MSGKLIKKQEKAVKRVKKLAQNGQMRSPLLAPDIQNHPFGWFFVLLIAGVKSGRILGN